MADISIYARYKAHTAKFLGWLACEATKNGYEFVDKTEGSETAHKTTCREPGPPPAATQTGGRKKGKARKEEKKAIQLEYVVLFYPRRWKDAGSTCIYDNYLTS
jgi:hypothetical protein